MNSIITLLRPASWYRI